MKKLNGKVKIWFTDGKHLWFFTCKGKMNWRDENFIKEHITKITCRADFAKLEPYESPAYVYLNSLSPMFDFI